MSRLLSKFPPGKAESSTGDLDHLGPTARVILDRSSDPAREVLQKRFRAACAAWKTATDNTNDGLADALGCSALQLKHWLSSDRSRRVPSEVVDIVERMAQQAKSGLSRDQIIDAVADLCRAEARFDRIRKMLLEATA